MKTELQQLIDECEAEADLLQRELNKCLDDFDYKGAYKFQKCLGLVKSKLGVLRQLENPYAVSLKKKQREIDFLIKHTTDLKQKYPHYYAESLEAKYLLKWKALDAARAELESKPMPFHVDGEVLINMFESMAANDIQRFTLALERPNTHICFSKQDSGLKIAVKVAVDEDSRVDLFRNKWSGLKGMGFTPTEDGAVLMLSAFDQTIIPSILEILSRLLYDVLGMAGGKKARIWMDD